MPLDFPQPPLTVGQQYLQWEWNGTRWVRISTGAGSVGGDFAIGGDLTLGGDADLAGDLTVAGQATFNDGVLLDGTDINDLATQQYVDDAIASQTLFQGTWEVANNDPDLTAATPVNGWFFIAVTANPAVAETAPSGIAGIAGETINNGDLVYWHDTEWLVVRRGSLTKTMADEFYVQDTILPAETYTVAVADLQDTIDELPRFLNRIVTINVTAGAVATDLVISRINGPGELNILGPDVDADFSCQFNRVVITNCDISRLWMRGITATADSGIGFRIISCGTALTYLQRCNATGGVDMTGGGLPTDTTNIGIECTESTNICCNNCTVSNKFRAFNGRLNSKLRVGASFGANNTVAFNAESSGEVCVASAPGITATTMYRQVTAGIVIGSDSRFRGYLDVRRTSDLAIVLTTDDLEAHGSQTLATHPELERAVQDTLFLSSSTTYTLQIIIQPGASTTAGLRLHGLNFRYGYVQVTIEPGVTLSLIEMYGNDVGRLLVNNCGNVNGNVNISYNQSRISYIIYMQNNGGTTIPVYPTGHPLAAMPIPIQLSRTTGGVVMRGNVSADSVGIQIGQFSEIGTVDANSLVNGGVANALGTNAPGTLQVIYNKACVSSYINVYCTASDTNDWPGPMVFGRMWVSYNESGYDNVINVQSSPFDGGQPTVELAYLHNNVTGRNTLYNLGQSQPISTFDTFLAATAEADNSTASRSTVVLTAPLPAAWEAAIVGYGFTFINQATTSSANNYTGTFKTVTAYDPATRTITLSGAFALPRPAGATCYFFPGQGQTRFYYGTTTNPKIERMLQNALTANAPVGLRQLEGNNFGTAYRVTAIDTTAKIVTIAPGLVAYGVYNGVSYPVGSFAPRTVQDYTIPMLKIGPNQYRAATTDVRFYPTLNVDLVGVRATGGNIPAGTSRAVATAAWSADPGLESRIVVSFEADPDPATPVDLTASLNFTFRRIPGWGHSSIYGNTSTGSAYGLLGSYCNGAGGGLRYRSQLIYNNQTAASAYVQMHDFIGNAVNPGGATKVDYIDVYQNTAANYAFIDARANNLPGGGGSLSRLRVYSNTAGISAYIVIGTYTTVQRSVEMFNNQAGLRCFITTQTAYTADVPGVPSGVTLNQASAPLIRACVYIYRNTAGLIYFNRLNVRNALPSETGRATDEACIRIYDNNGRVYPESASIWLDNANNNNDNACCIYISTQWMYSSGQVISCTYGTGNNYAMRVSSGYLTVSNIPAGKIKLEQQLIVLWSYGLAPVGNIYNEFHQPGQDRWITILRDNKPLIGGQEMIIGANDSAGPGQRTITLPNAV